jgi:CRP-like cAMP-binding protein/di/tricarboxylate transporter
MTEATRPEEVLTRTGAFAVLGRVDLAKLAAYLDPVDLPAGAEVFRQGDVGASLYIVADGALGVFVTADDRHLRVDTLAPGDLFGEMALFTGAPRSATVRAECASTVLELPRERFFELMRREPALSLVVAATLSERLRLANESRAEHASVAAAALDEGLRRIPHDQRELVLEASLLESRAPAVLRAAFGDRAETAAGGLAALGAGGDAAGVIVRALRERLTRELGQDRLAGRVAAVAERLALGGLWNEALGVLATSSTPDMFAEMLARALRAVPAFDSEHALRWIERVPDHDAMRDAELALTRARFHESRGDATSALRVLQRALGVALVGPNPAGGARLSIEIARLGNTRSAAVAVGVRPKTSVSSRHSRRFGPHACLVIGAVSVVAAAWPGGGRQWAFLALLLAAIALMLSRIVPEFAIGLVLVTGWVLLGIGTTAEALGGFASKEWLFVVATYGLAAATARSGLLLRLGLLLVRRLPDGVAAQTATLLVTGLFLTPLVPSSTGRASLTAPLALAVAEALRLPERGRSAALLGLGTWVGAGPLMFVFLNGSGTCLLAWGLLPEVTRTRFNWTGWVVAAAPLGILVAAGSLLILRAMFPPEPVPGRTPQRVRLQLAALGPIAPREVTTIAIITLTVAGWVVAPWLGLDLATVALLGLLATVAIGTFDRATLQSLDWGFLIFFGAVLTVGRLGATIGLDRTAATTIDGLLGTTQPPALLFVLAVALASLVIRLALDQDLTVVLVGVAVLPVAPRLGVDPFIVVMALLATSVTWFVPSQTTSYLVAQSASEGRLFSHSQAQRFAFAYTALTLLGLALSVPYWRFLKLL